LTFFPTPFAFFATGEPLTAVCEAGGGLAEGGGRRRDAQDVGAFLTEGRGAGTAGAGGASAVEGEGTTATGDFEVVGEEGAGEEAGMVAGGEGAGTEEGVGGDEGDG